MLSPASILLSKKLPANTSINNIAPGNTEHGWREASAVNLSRIGAALAFGAALFVCWRAAEIRPAVLFSPGTSTALWTFIRGLFPPDLSLDFLRVVGAAIVRAGALAIAGTSLAVAIGLPVGEM